MPGQDLHDGTRTRAANRLFRDRREAGRFLAELLADYRGRPDVLVLALPRGGVPVAFEVASALDAPLDVFSARKLGVPGHEELAMGALASGGVVVLNDDVVRGFDIPPETIERVAAAEGRELDRRERAYREGRPPPDVAGRTVIVVDDGLATGSSMQAAVLALRNRTPAAIVVAVPAAPESTCRELAFEADDVVCATTPAPFFAVGQSYWDFTQTTDEEVRQLLRTARRRPRAAPRPPDELDSVRSALVPLEAGRDALLRVIGSAELALIGEASHGTHEFYEERAQLTRHLIERCGFCAVAVEGDWPDAYRVHRFVQGRSDDATAEEALRGFERFPTWMWRNEVLLDFVGWLREHNGSREAGDVKAGFYGLDLYSLHRSIAAVLAYLEQVDPDAAARARERYACFDHYGTEGHDYGLAAAFGAGESCEREVLDQLVDLQRHGFEYVRRDGLLAEDELFYAEQNARTVKDAEQYYRTMFRGQAASWNLRDRHMVETLGLLRDHFRRRHGSPPKTVVWAHNSHLGDARATEVSTRGELNVGQLVREQYGDACRLVGFTTYAGTVTAADDWGAPAERKRVRPGLPGSVEALFHDAGTDAFVVPLTGPGSAAVADALRTPRLERAIGVIYRPRTERQSHYFRARVAEQFDAVIHVDESRALEPLERTAGWERGEAPETFPYAV